MGAELLTQFEEIAEEITLWRRRLHQVPELGMHLPQTAKIICESLESLGIAYQTYQDHSGVCAVVGDPSAGKCIALRADMDALPIVEQVESTFKSQNENMHACGHDSHAAMLLGAAKVLKQKEESLCGCVKLIFQTGEETGDGALAFLKDRALEEPHVDAMISLHVDRTRSEKIKNGDFIIKRGPTHASNDEFILEIIGKGGHGGYPHMSVDAISVASLVVSNLQYIISREISPISAATISFGEITTGNGAVNIIPDSVTIKGIIRCGTEETRAFVRKRFQEIAENICKAMRASCNITIINGESAVSNDDTMTDIVEASAVKLFGADAVHSMREQTMGSEDVGYYFEKIPGSVFRFCNALPYSDGVIYPLHNPKMVIDDKNLYRGAALLAQSAIDYLAT